jgi:hypothetical protein
LVDNNLFLKWKFPADLNLGVSSTLSVKMEGKNGDGAVLTFKTSLYLTVSASGPPTVTLSCIMKGWWDRAFGIKPLSIGDLAGKISLTTVAPFVASFEVNGKAKFGEAFLSVGTHRICDYSSLLIVPQHHSTRSFHMCLSRSEC